MRQSQGATYNGISWALSHIFVGAFIVLLIVAIMVPSRPDYLGVVSHSQLVSGASFIGFCLIEGFLTTTVAAAAFFKPATILQAKSANEQIKLVATLLNNLAVGSIVTAIFAQFGRIDESWSNLLAAIALVMALQLHGVAKLVLGYIKDESGHSAATEDQG